MKRVILFRNGAQVDGKVLLMTQSLDDFLAAASAKFGVKIKRLFTPQGGEIDDHRLIRDDDVLYASAGEPFIAVEQNPHQTTKLLQPSPSTPLPTSALGNPDWVLLNVGGKYFATTRRTLTCKEPSSMLARMFADEDGILLWPSTMDKNGAFLIDRSPMYFEPILNYLRHGQLVLDKNVSIQGVLEEAKFFGINSLIPTLEAMIQQEEEVTRDTAPLTRRDVINALISTPYTAELRFQGVNLAGADLSRLDLRYINFKYAILQGAKLTAANLSYCCLERADLSHCNLEGAVLLGVKMLCANMEGACMCSCNMEDPVGNRANLEGVNLKGANLEGSHMSGVNLRVATLKNANLQNCDLRGAVLAGADLENCDLSGSDLHEANLRGANLKNAAFELMLTPLHMAQAIR